MCVCLCIYVSTCPYVIGSVGLWVLCICVSVRLRVCVSVPMSVSVRMSVFMLLKYQNSRRVFAFRKDSDHIYTRWKTLDVHSHLEMVSIRVCTPLSRSLKMYVQPA